MHNRSEPEDGWARFEALYRAEYPAVAGYIRRRAEPDVVEDLVEEVFLVVWRRLDSVPDDPRSWLLAVARNVLGTHIRGAHRRRALDARLAAREIDWTSPPPEIAGGEAIMALAGLAPKDQEALMLVSWDGLSPQEAAVVLGERPSTFRVRLHRARSRFRRALEQSAGSGADTADPHPNRRNILKEVPNGQNS